MTTLAAVDIGTNSIHMVVARSSDGVTFEILSQEKEMVRLGEGSGPGDLKELTAAAIDRGIACLERYRTVADAAGAQVRAVATSAVREADNGDLFVKRARDEAGVDVEIISGVEEARLIRLGVLQAVPVLERRSLVFDIGGGSTEYIVGEGDQVLVARSLKLGAIRLTSRFFPDGTVRSRAVTAARAFIRSALVQVSREMRDSGFDVAIGSSGTIEAVAGLVQELRGAPQLQTFNNFEMSLDEVEAAVHRLVKAGSLDRRRRMPGVDPRRADILPAGALVLAGSMEELGIRSVLVSGYALREGCCSTPCSGCGAGRCTT